MTWYDSHYTLCLTHRKYSHYREMPQGMALMTSITYHNYQDG